MDSPKSTTTTGIGGKGTHSTLVAPTPPKMSEFDLTNVRIERAENGVVVECNYRMKPEVQKKMQGKNGNGYVDYDVRQPTEKHVFNDIAAAAEFLEARLLGKEYTKHEKSEPAEKIKVKKV